MANILIYPFINPLQLFDPEPTLNPQYRSKDFIDFDFPDTILPWQQSVGFCQKWQKSNTIYLQLQTNVGPVNFILKDCDGAIVDTIPFVQGPASVNTPGLFIYEVSVPLAGYDEGCYYAEVTFGSGPVVFLLRSNSFDIKTEVLNSVNIQYSNYEFREDVIFETGIVFEMRLLATNKYQKTANKSTTYEDQVMNVTALRNVSFRTWKLFIGRAIGIPDWLADKIGRIIGCSTFKIDNKSFTKPQDAELEPNEVDNYPMRGWTVDLRERFNRGAREYENEIPINGKIAVAVNVSAKGFGNMVGGNPNSIIDVN